MSIFLIFSSSLFHTNAVKLPLITSKALCSKIWYVEIFDSRIIVIVPFLIIRISDEWVKASLVSALFSCAVVDNNAFQLVLVVILRMLSSIQRLFLRNLFILFFFLYFVLSYWFFHLKTFLSVREHIKVHWELIVIVYFVIYHKIEIEIESRERDNHDVW
jgi:hypothetical protein